jgi:hypothetical protein
MGGKTTKAYARRRAIAAAATNTSRATPPATFYGAAETPTSTR